MNPTELMIQHLRKWHIPGTRGGKTGTEIRNAVINHTGAQNWALVFDLLYHTVDWDKVAETLEMK
jgi:hypothetical protein